MHTWDMCVCSVMCVALVMVKGQLVGICSLLRCLGPDDQIQDSKFGGKHLYLLSRLASYPYPQMLCIENKEFKRCLLRKSTSTKRMKNLISVFM